MKKLLIIFGSFLMATAAMGQSDLLDSLSDYSPFYKA